MRMIVLLDITIADTNLGNAIIMSAVEQNLRKVFPSDFFVRVSSADGLGPSARELVRHADLVFLCGANTLYSHLWLFKPWRVGIREAFLMREKVVTVGVGWMRHKRLSERWMSPDLYTQIVYRLALSKEFYHSVRDSYAERKLREMGFKVLNTGCPSLWSLSGDHCKSIPSAKGRFVITTLTCYREDLEEDRKLFHILRRHYEKVFFWPQQPKDSDYARKVFGGEMSAIEFIPPTLEALDSFLKSDLDVDYVGTRLHAYIRALQQGRRAINVGVDDRALEMAKDFGLVVVPRGEWGFLEELIKRPFESQIRVPHEVVQLFKEQFRRKQSYDVGTAN